MITEQLVYTYVFFVGVSIPCAFILGFILTKRVRLETVLAAAQCYRVGRRVRRRVLDHVRAAKQTAAMADPVS